MPRIAGVDIPPEKPVWVSLAYIKGIGPTTSREVLKEAGIDPQIRAKKLTEDEVGRIASIIERNHVVEGALHRRIQQDIQRLKEIGCYRGIRHRRGLPVRGQRTRTNARTRKGPRRTVAVKRSVKEMRG
jgi:small subunit ribosomal protein S13